MIIRILIYVLAVIAANLIVWKFGKYGLFISSFTLIPFDFVMRCYFHERWKGAKLVFNLGVLITCASIATYLINMHTQQIAIASCAGFIVANIVAGLLYQVLIKRTYFVKINLTDLAAIVVDSICFQLIAFGGIDAVVTGGQIVIKFAGGLLWYYLLFKKLDK